MFRKRKRQSGSPCVLYVDQSGELGGGEISLLSILKELGNDAELVLLNGGELAEQVSELQIKVHVLSDWGISEIRRRSNVLVLLRYIYRILCLSIVIARHSRRFDIVYANSIKAFAVSAIAAMLSRKPLIWHIRDILSVNRYNRYSINAIVWLANRTCSHAIANSEATASSFRLAGGRSKISVIYNGIDGSAFNCQPATIKRGRIVSSEKGGSGLLIGHFGRLAYWKGQHVLLSALTRIDGAHVIFVGGPLFGEESYELWLKQETIRYNLTDRVHFLGFRSDVPQLMKSVDIVTHTSIEPEPFGRVIVEGMLAERPVIASRSGGPLEIIRHLETGYLTPPGDVEALRNAILTLSGDPILSRKIAENGRRAAQERFTISGMIKGIVDVEMKVYNTM